jgi:hypothetical protein
VNPSVARKQGVVASGITHVPVRADKNAIYAKKDAHGLIIIKCQSLALVGTYEEGAQPAAAVDTMEKLGDYLRERDLF